MAWRGMQKLKRLNGRGAQNCDQTMGQALVVKGLIQLALKLSYEWKGCGNILIWHDIILNIMNGRGYLIPSYMNGRGSNIWMSVAPHREWLLVARVKGALRILAIHEAKSGKNEWHSKSDLWLQSYDYKSENLFCTFLKREYIWRELLTKMSRSCSF